MIAALAGMAMGVAVVAGVPAQAAVQNFSGSNNIQGYAVLTFSLFGTAVVDIQHNGGPPDATMSLFDGLGNLVIVADDFGNPTSSSNPRITLTLPAASYSLLTGYCCGEIYYASAQGATASLSDGTNDGTYWTGGTATLAGLTAYLAGYNVSELIYPYSVTVASEALIGEQVTAPEPAGFAVLGMGLAGMALRRRRT